MQAAEYEFGLSMREMWLRKSVRQGAGSEGAEWEVVAILREVCSVRDRCARRRLAAMVVVAVGLVRVFVGLG